MIIGTAFQLLLKTNRFAHNALAQQVIAVTNVIHVMDVIAVYRHVMIGVRIWEVRLCGMVIFMVSICRVREISPLFHKIRAQFI